MTMRRAIEPLQPLHVKDIPLAGVVVVAGGEHTCKTNIVQSIWQEHATCQTIVFLKSMDHEESYAGLGIDPLFIHNSASDEELGQGAIVICEHLLKISNMCTELIAPKLVVIIEDCSHLWLSNWLATYAGAKVRFLIANAKELGALVIISVLCHEPIPVCLLTPEAAWSDSVSMIFLCNQDLEIAWALFGHYSTRFPHKERFKVALEVCTFNHTRTLVLTPTNGFYWNPDVVLHHPLLPLQPSSKKGPGTKTS
jgi:hypothetical protein